MDLVVGNVDNRMTVTAVVTCGIFPFYKFNFNKGNNNHVQLCTVKRVFIDRLCFFRTIPVS